MQELSSHNTQSFFLNVLTYLHFSRYRQVFICVTRRRSAHCAWQLALNYFGDPDDVNAERSTAGLLGLSPITDPDHNTTFRELDFCPQAVAHNRTSATGVDPVSKTLHLSVVLSEDEKRSGLLLYVTSGTRHEGLRHQAVAHNSPSATGVDPVSKTRHLSVVLSEDEKRSGLLLYVTSGTRHEGLRQQVIASPAVTLTKGKYKRQNNTKSRYNNELHTLYDELDIDKVIKTGRLRWLGHIFRMRDLDPSRRLTVLKAKGMRRAGKVKATKAQRGCRGIALLFL